MTTTISADDAQVRQVSECLIGAADDAGVARIPQAQMSARTGLAQRTLRRAIARMEEAGWLRIVDPGSPNSPAAYDIARLVEVAKEAGWEPASRPSDQDDLSGMRVIREKSPGDLSVRPGERLLIDPHLLDAGENVRQKLRLDDVFVDTIRELGILKDIDVYQTLTGLVVLDGHRRLQAALDAGLESVPVRVVEVSSEEQRIATQLIENDAHLHTAAIERALAVQQLVLFGMSAKDLRRHGVSRDELAAAKRVVSAPPAVGELAEAAPKLDLVTLGKVAELAETAASEEDYEDLVSRIREEPEQVDFIIEQERLEAERRAMLAKARADYEARGIKVVEEKGNRAEAISYLVDESGARLSEAEHESCPGHAVELTLKRWMDKPEARIVCLDWVAAGHRNAWARNTSGTTSGPMSDEQKQKRAELIEKNKQGEAAAVVRIGWVRHTLLARRKLPKDWALFAAPTIEFAMSNVSSYTQSGAIDAIGIDRRLYAAPDTGFRAERGLLAFALAAAESTFRKDFWRVERFERVQRMQRLYLRSLEAWGYALSELEAEFCGRVEREDKGPDLEYADEICAYRHAVPAKEDLK